MSAAAALAVTALADELTHVTLVRDALLAALKAATHEFDPGVVAGVQICCECYAHVDSPKHMTPARVFAALAREKENAT